MYGYILEIKETVNEKNKESHFNSIPLDPFTANPCFSFLN